jgi:hypothetical protein
MNDLQIDIVLPWVDFNDPLWRKELEKYATKSIDFSQYRNWDNLEYLFRGIDKFMPWVNKIFFITYGHLPNWLNTEHPKLIIITHEEFLKKSSLPIFSIIPIEINLHNIKGLSEKFIYFNDDTFVLKEVKSEEFFKNNLPVDFLKLSLPHEGVIRNILSNNMDLINKNFNRHTYKYSQKQIIYKNLKKFFNFDYGMKALIRSFYLSRFDRFLGFEDPHQPQAFLKSTFEKVWNKEKEYLNNVSQSRFRSCGDINQYFFRYWQLLEGNFVQADYTRLRATRKYKNIKFQKDAYEVVEDLKSNKYQLYCINDGFINDDGRFYRKDDVSQEEFLVCKNLIIEALNNIFPEKSSFEL